ncbi:glutamine amidotransferase subunit pdxt [Cystoisospora suis]|uniref:glutaminase n=1 Tax=Cystoisospora suis TaxID=483139 RepID=A0A2C6LEY0_9APIC|nr:glutamine amidotransferase subunit pdxt [Cystoisospora suis]
MPRVSPSSSSLSPKTLHFHAPPSCCSSSSFSSSLVNRKSSSSFLHVGILALQGAFLDHLKAFKRLDLPSSYLQVSLVKTASDLRGLDGLVIPGGESTAMRIIAGTELLGALKDFVHRQKKPVWGTCAGCILLSDRVCLRDAVEKEKKRRELLSDSSSSLDTKEREKEEEEGDGYGEFIRGAPVQTCRNYFGRQVDSFEAPLRCEGRLREMCEGMTAVCIRAPAILQTLSDDAEVLGYIDLPERHERLIAAVGCVEKPLLLTTFHPELTDDSRLHAVFLLHFVLPHRSSSGIREDEEEEEETNFLKSRLSSLILDKISEFTKKKEKEMMATNRSSMKEATKEQEEEEREKTSSSSPPLVSHSRHVACHNYRHFKPRAGQ